MKLKLEVQDGVAILRVFEDLGAAHADILKAGLLKLIASGKKEVIIDLTSAGVVDGSAHRGIQALHDLAHESDAQLVIASPNETIGQARSVRHGLELIRSLLFMVLSQETRLRTRMRLLEHRRETLRTQLAGADSTTIRNIRFENTQLLSRVTELESQIAALLKDEQPSKPHPVDAKLKSVQHATQMVLASIGLGPMGSG